MNRTYITQSISQALHSLTMPIDMRLYGSEPWGEVRADSDIDLLIADGITVKSHNGVRHRYYL